MTKIPKLYKEWQSLQPLSEDKERTLNQQFMVDFNYNSNHLEGNTLTYGQTRLLLLFGDTMGNASMQDYEEMKAH
ncbi:MAG: Fic family protein, partial [Culturomica sp.]|nr:Fic family protein [Culturomica sp.]